MQRKHRRLDLVRVQVHAGVEQGLTQAFDAATCVLQGQVVRGVFGLVGGEQDSSATGRKYEPKGLYRNVFRTFIKLSCSLFIVFVYKDESIKDRGKCMAEHAALRGAGVKICTKPGQGPG